MSSFPVLFVIIKGLFVAFNVGFIALIYFALRGPGVSRPVRVGLCLLAVALSLASPIAHEIDGNAPWLKTISIAGHFWFAFMYHAALAGVLYGVFRLFNRRFRWVVIADRVRWRHRSCAGIAVASLLMCLAGWINMQYPAVREEQLIVPVGVAPLRIVALSDLHLGRSASVDFFSSVIDRIEPLSPDIVLFLGDILEHDFAPSEAPAAAAVLERLKPRLGIWGVMGNHEYLNDKGELSKNSLDRIGIRILIDQWEILGEKPGEKILLIGRRDRRVGRKPVQEVIADVPKGDGDALKILLDHQPVDLEGPEKAGVHLQLSGHSHNGQFFPLNFIVSLLFENAYGHYTRGQTHYWVTSGVGNWGPKVRTTGRPEIMLIDLVPQPEAPSQ
ncbi:MAG: metallophosphoesterase [Azoarcus sp.]|jgi:predicted MPP superfamily phosphohydrolase|nr:metallophosphoesterase [Azoarcus sp.]